MIHLCGGSLASARMLASLKGIILKREEARRVFFLFCYRVIVTQISVQAQPSGAYKILSLQ